MDYQIYWRYLHVAQSSGISSVGFRYFLIILLASRLVENSDLVKIHLIFGNILGQVQNLVICVC